MKKERVIFFGNDAFSLPTLINLHKDYEVVLVITKHDRPVGREKKLTPNPVKKFCIEEQIPYHETSLFRKDTHTHETIRSMRVSVGVVVSFGYIIPQEVIDLFPLGIINIHPSALPLYRGSSPLQTALLNGDETSAITIMRIDAELDHGPILTQEEFSLTKYSNYGEVYEFCRTHGGVLLKKTLDKYLKGDITPTPQDHHKATFCKMIKKEDGVLDLSKDLVYTIHSKVRAFTPWPSCRLVLKNHEEYKILETKIDDIVEYQGSEPFLTKNSKLYLKGANNQALRVTKIQPQGKIAMSDTSFINGYRSRLVNIT